MSLLWENLRLKNIEPTSVEKFGIALFLMSVSYIIIAIAGWLSEFKLVSPMWLVAGYFVMTVAELCLSPIGLSLVSKLAPKQFLSLAMGTWFLMCFSGNLFAGLIGGEYENFPHWMLFGSLATLSFLTFIVMSFFFKKLNKTLEYTEK
jgi:POT family proton-dependent oligopeptide transporter